MSAQYKDFKFVSREGEALIKKILLQEAKIEPHDHQLEVLTHALDRVDTLATIYTGGGKSGYIWMLDIILRALVKDPTLCPHFKVPENPLIIVICPTLALEEDLALKVEKYGARALVLNKERVDEYTRAGNNIFEDAADPKYSVILMTPEMLSSKPARALMQKPAMQKRQVALMVDEAHLLYTWGPGFRMEYTQIGHMRKGLFSEAIPLIAFTATLRPGEPGDSPRDSVCRFLGFKPGQFHLVQRSNARYETRIVVRPFRHSSQSSTFPDLDWIAREPGKILVFCSGIKMGHKIAAYLLTKWNNPSTSNRPHTYNRLHTDQFNRETIELIRSSSHIVVIATDTLSVGIDLSDIDTVVVLDPSDIDDAWQKGGRGGRDLRRVPHPRVIIYVPAKVFKGPPPSAPIPEAQDRPPDTTIPRLVFAACKTRAIDVIYGNDPNEQPCGCLTCRTSPRARFPSTCECSSCLPEPAPSLPTAPAMPAKKTPLPESKRITPAMREIATARLQKFRLALLRRLPDDEDAARSAVMSDISIEDVVKRLQNSLDYDSVEPVYQAMHDGKLRREEMKQHAMLKPVVSGNKFLENSAHELLEVIHDLHVEFKKMRRQKLDEKNARKRETYRVRQDEAKRAKIDEGAAGIDDVGAEGIAQASGSVNS
ncbi:P-loop containing nucleoside triphosphate hydrolase protein [Schizophyllum commune]